MNFEITLTLGDVIQIIVLVFGFSKLYFSLDKRVSIIETLLKNNCELELHFKDR